MIKKYIFIAPQVDYFSGGAFELKEADKAIPHIQHFIDFAGKDLVLIEAAYPADHPSFVSSHLWRKPGQKFTLSENYEVDLKIPHLVEGSFGALRHPKLTIDQGITTFKIGESKEGVIHSAFYDAPFGKSNGLEEWLVYNKVEELILAGMQSDLLVLQTAKIALQKGLQVKIVDSACVPADHDKWESFKQGSSLIEWVD